MVTRKEYFAIKAALTRSEKDLIDYYEIQWTLKSYVPTIEEVAKYLKLSQVTVNYYLMRKPVMKALDDRGIKWKQHTQSELTATQVAVARTMMNFVDTRPNDEKLDELGVNATQYAAWLQDPQFSNLINVLADRNLEGIRPTAVTEFTKLINKGDWQAVKYYLDITGTAGQNEAPQNEALIIKFIEIIQKWVKDPDIIRGIAQDVQLAAANRTLEIAASPRQTFNGEVVNDGVDYELENAKKKLGIG